MVNFYAKIAQLTHDKMVHTASLPVYAATAVMSEPLGLHGARHRATLKERRERYSAAACAYKLIEARMKARALSSSSRGSRRPRRHRQVDASSLITKGILAEMM